MTCYLIPFIASVKKAEAAFGNSKALRAAAPVPARNFLLFNMVVLGLIILGIVLFIRKLALKGNLERGLGRKVKDSDLTSLTAWMDATPEPKRRD